MVRFTDCNFGIVIYHTQGNFCLKKTLGGDGHKNENRNEDNNTIRKNTVYSYELEGTTLLSDEDSCSLRYIKQVTDVTKFSPLFLEVFVLQLALKLIPPLAGVGSAGQALAADIKLELYGSRGRPGLMARVRALERQEGDRIGRSERALWNNSRSANFGRIDSKLGGN